MVATAWFVQGPSHTTAQLVKSPEAMTPVCHVDIWAAENPRAELVHDRVMAGGATTARTIDGAILVAAGGSAQPANSSSSKLLTLLIF